MNEKTWRQSIENALKAKGFSKKGARKTAKMTIRKSKAKRASVASESRPYSVRSEIVDGQLVNIKVYPPVSN